VYQINQFKTETNMGQVAYYMRTSHYLQSIGTQVDKIEDGWKVYEDAGVSGRVPFEERPAGKRLLDDVRRGKISQVIVLRLDRCGRSTQNILETLDTIHSFKVPITSLNEGITTLNDKGEVTPMTGLLTNVLSSLSEFFYHQTREKTLAGVKRGVLLNHYKGRKVGSVETFDKFISKPKNKKIKEMIDAGVGIRKISRILECSPNSIYKVKERMLEQV
jgi:DNA invertase Pin-like site-specific DNA recombinase